MKENKNEPNEEKKVSESIPKKELEKTKEVRPSGEKIKRGGFNLGNMLIGTIIVFMGIMLLGNTTGWYDININLWQLWPLLIIFIGLSLLSRGGWVSGLIATLVTLIIIAIVGFMMFFGVGDEGVKVGESISIKKAHGVKSAIIRIETGAGKLTIDKGDEELISGKFKSNYLTLKKESRVKGDVQELTLNTVGSWRGIGGQINDLKLSISPDIPVDFELATGAIDMDIDLSEIIAESVDISTGASSLNLVMGDKVDSSIVKINSGASSINITLPRTVGARVTIDAALTSRELNNFKKLDSNTYESDNYDMADKKVAIELNAGVSSLMVDWN